MLLPPVLRRALRRPASPKVERTAFFAGAHERFPFVSVEVDGVVYVISTADTGVGRKLFITRFRPEFVVLRRVLSVIGAPAPGSTIVDVGANIGTTTLPALVEHGFAHAVACEPGPEALQALRMSVTANGVDDRATVIGAAISDTDGVIHLETDTSSFGTRRVAIPGVTAGRTLDVESVRLDTLVDRGVIDPAGVGLFWIDAQGHEGHVLQGAGRILAERPPTVVALRGQKLRDAGGIESMCAALERNFSAVIDLRGDTVRRDAWEPVREEIGAVRRWLEEEGRKTDVLVLPEGR